MQAFHQTSSRGLVAYLPTGFAKSCKAVSEQALISKPTLIAFPEKETVIQHRVWEIHKAKKGWEPKFSLGCFGSITASWPRSSGLQIVLFIFTYNSKGSALEIFWRKVFVFSHSISKTSLDHLKPAIFCRYRNSKVTEHFQNAVLNMEDLLACLVMLWAGWQIHATAAQTWLEVWWMDQVTCWFKPVYHNIPIYRSVHWLRNAICPHLFELPWAKDSFLKLFSIR